MIEQFAEQRQFSRVSHQTPVGIAVLEIIDRSKGGRVVVATSLDISRSGMRIITERELSGVDLRIRFQLPGGDHVTVDATVVRRRNNGTSSFEYGLSFDTSLPASCFPVEQVIL